jgi:hypothetical protein
VSLSVTFIATPDGIAGAGHRRRRHKAAAPGSAAPATVTEVAV